MGAVNAMLRETQEAELAEAVAAANRWTDIARPLILASIEMERLAYDTVYAPLGKLDGDKSFTFLRDDAAEEARKLIERAAYDLNPIIESLRDNFIADYSKSWSRDLTEEEGDAVDEFNEALAAEVVSVVDFVKRVEREDYERFMGRAAA